MKVRRSSTVLKSDQSRVLLQYFGVGNDRRILNVISRIEKLSDQEAASLVSEIRSGFSKRHTNFENRVAANCSMMKHHISTKIKLSADKIFLLGAYFSKEYSIEAAALFNASIVPDPVSGSDGKFVMSLRSTGEGHISSIEFREGKIDSDGNVSLSETSRFVSTGKISAPDKWKKKDVIAISKYCHGVTENDFDGVHDEFTLEEFKQIFKLSLPTKMDLVSSYLESFYTIEFSGNEPLSERILFPYSSSESAGMEDVRWVRFVNDDKSVVYYGTYTAYNGKTFRSQLIETKDFKKFAVSPMYGEMIKDKGMAIFPRKVNGKYVITSRLDGENLYIMESDDIRVWEKAKKIYEPELFWEFVQLGNCGSPIETKEGWLLITHSVGAFRKYVISVYLLELNDPSKIIGRLNNPLISPNEDEREGYVPNVVYSCGSMVHNGNLVIPYAMSDSRTSFATVSVDELLQQLKSEK